MSGLVAGATMVLHLAGRVGLATLLAAFLVTYAVFGLLLTPVVALGLAAIAFPGRLRALCHHGVGRHGPELAALRRSLRHRIRGPVRGS